MVGFQCVKDDFAWCYKATQTASVLLVTAHACLCVRTKADAICRTLKKKIKAVEADEIFEDNFATKRICM